MPLYIDGTNGITFPTWTTSARPASPAIGAMGYNTSYGGVELWNGSAWDTITGGPSFSAYVGTQMSGITSATWTKIAYNTSEYDTNSNYSTSNYRFTPTVAGYYLFTWCADTAGSASTTLNLSTLYKNGAQAKRGTGISVSNNETYTAGSAVVYMNGSTDYAEVYVYIAVSGTGIVYTGSTSSFFQASMVRSA